MKFVCFLLICCLLSGTIYSQTVAVAAEKLNKVYIGMDNRMTITSEKCSCDEITATVDAGEIRKEKGCNFILYVERQGQVTITVKKKSGGKETLIGTKKLKANYIPAPEARVGNRKSGRFPVGEFKAQTGVTIVQQGFEGTPYFYIISFEIRIYRNKALIFSDYGDGAYFRKESKDFIQTLRAGDVVEINNIKCTCPGCRIQSINSLSYIMS